MSITRCSFAVTALFLCVIGSPARHAVAADCESSAVRFSTTDIRHHKLYDAAEMPRSDDDEQRSGFAILDATLLTGGRWIVARLVTYRPRRPDEIVSGFSLRPTPEIPSCMRLIAVSLETDERVMLTLADDARESDHFGSSRIPTTEFDRIIPSACGDTCLFVLTHQKEGERSSRVFQWDVARRRLFGSASDPSAVALWTGFRMNDDEVSVTRHDAEELVSVRIGGRTGGAIFQFRPGFLNIVPEVNAPGERVVRDGGDGKSLVVTKDFGTLLTGDMLVRCYDVDSEHGVRWELGQSDIAKEEIIQVLPLGRVEMPDAYCLCIVHRSNERNLDAKYVIVCVDNQTGAVLKKHSLPVFSLWTNPVLCTKRRAIVCAAGTPEEGDTIAVISVDTGEVEFEVVEEPRGFTSPLGCSQDGKIIVNNGSAIYQMDDSATHGSEHGAEMLFELLVPDSQ